MDVIRVIDWVRKQADSKLVKKRSGSIIGYVGCPVGH
jgi:hypothetical protein